ncbi:hypothetical protein J2T17_007123 [Paenibacillus mucilaginosus]|uniref:hypothetical protein n=1 Tax=Paenibacillus mucilaginosus TaxID=61624 RepID=UPI003D1BDEFD
MAVPFYEKSSGILVIEWTEAKENGSSVTRHHFEDKPMKLQLHPMVPAMLIRAHFRGKMPHWMTRYVKEKEHPFECQEVFQDGEIGWWIANWKSFASGMKPMSAPTVRGGINNLIQRIPEVCEDYRERLRDGMEIIECNLLIDPSFYESYGLYFRPEEVNADGCAIVVEEDLIPVRYSEEDDTDYEARIRLHGRLDKLIYELTTPIPVIPTEEEEVAMALPAEEESSEEESLFTFEAEEEEFVLAFEEGEEGFSFAFDEEEGEFELHFSEEEHDSSPLQFDDEEETDLYLVPTSGGVAAPYEDGADAEDSVEPAEQAEESPAASSSEDVTEQQPEQMEAAESVEEETASSVAAAAPAAAPAPSPVKPKASGVVELRVEKRSSKKSNSLAGQMSFF